ncbi:MAG: hypothetical protein WCD76_08325 [Pyrinomonadaceae bacterium]
MSDLRQSERLTAGERMTAAFLRWAPWLAFFIVALPLPAYFLLRYFAATEEQAVYMLLTLSSLAAGSIAGLVVALVFLFYRMRWLKRLRDRLAADGVTAGELFWFKSELTSAERRTLAQMKSRHPLLADAYGETLAARVTAARVLASSRREAVAVEGRLLRASRLQDSGSAALLKDLQDDRTRLERVTRQASEQSAGFETRLQMIEALASRDASESEIERALLRLNTAHEYEPLALTNAQMERAARTEVEDDLQGTESATND